MMIELRVGRISYKVNCQESEKEKILELADRLDSRVSSLAHDLKNADDQTLLLITSLLLEEELEVIKEGRRANDDHSDELYEALAQTINNIAIHIEKITERVRSGSF